MDFASPEKERISLASFRGVKGDALTNRSQWRNCYLRLITIASNSSEAWITIFSEVTVRSHPVCFD